MIPNHQNVEVIKSHVPTDTLEMAISTKAENMGLLMILLRDNLYSNKSLAPIREYSTNARDAHIEAKIPNRPIEVTLPSTLDPTLRIRDFGAGLDYNELKDTYFIYLESTKRNTNDTNGVLGLGSKSAFAYGDIFIVTSIKNGRKLIVTCPSTGKPSIDFNGPTTEESGVEIAIPILMGDVNTFVSEALNFYKYWDVKPILKNVSKEVVDTYFRPLVVSPIFFEENSWEIRPAGGGYGESRAIMSNVPYPVDWRIVEQNLPTEISSQVGGIFEFVQSNIVTLRFDNGDLEFTPNREALQYNEFTLKAIGKKLISIYNTILTLITNRISGAQNIWEAMCIYNQVFHSDLLTKGEQFGGNLHRIQSLLSGKLKWKDQVISGGKFENLNKWDKNNGYDPNGGWRGSYLNYLFQTYVKTPDGIKLLRTHRRRNNSIIADPKAVIVIQDIQKSYKGAAARYIFDVLHKDATKVYLLDLSIDAVKTSFFKSYPILESVPALYTSKIEDDIKKHTSSLKGPRGAGSPSSVSTDRTPQFARFVEIKDRRSSPGGHVGSAFFSQSDTNIKGIEDGGVYVVIDNKERIIHNNQTHESNQIIQAFYDLCKLSGRTVDKVYGIRESTTKTKWFVESVNEGLWMNMWDVIKEDSECIDSEELSKLEGFYNSVGQYTIKYIGINACKKLLPLIEDTDTNMYRYCQEVSTIEDKKYLRFIVNTLRLNDIVKENGINFSKLGKSLISEYPMIFHMNEWNNIGNNDPNDTYHSLHDSLVKMIAGYINMVDSRSTIYGEVKKVVDNVVVV
jgi:hypothetical protein